MSRENNRLKVIIEMVELAQHTCINIYFRTEVRETCYFHFHAQSSCEMSWVFPGERRNRVEWVRQERVHRMPTLHRKFFVSSHEGKETKI